MLGSLHRAEQATQAALEPEAAAKPVSAQPGKSRRQARGASVRQAHGEQTAAKPATRQTGHAAQSGRGAPKQTAQGKKNAHSVRVAGLKKR